MPGGVVGDVSALGFSPVPNFVPDSSTPRLCETTRVVLLAQMVEDEYVRVR